MKFLSRLLLLCLLGWGSALAQPRLPLCQGNDSTNWSSCRGTYSFPDGSKYSGEFNAGNFGGFGTFYYANGSVYVGEWFNGKHNGNGSLTYRNGTKYVGEWRGGYQNGMGVEFTVEGRVLASGTYLNGRNNASHAVNTQRFPFNSSVVADVSQTPMPDTGKAERDRLAADLEASRKKQQELEVQLLASQVAVTQNSRPAQNISTERRVALVIGNATYKVNPLKNPVNDSSDMARSLRSVGFDVIEANNKLQSLQIVIA